MLDPCKKRNYSCEQYFSQHILLHAISFCSSSSSFSSPDMDKNFPIWDNLVFYEQIHNIRTIIWKFQMFDKTWLKIRCLVKVVACLFHKSSTYIAAVRGYKYIPVWWAIYPYCPYLLCMSHDTQLTCSYSKWVSYQNSNVVVDPNTWELKIFVLYEERRGEMGEERREEKREIHVDEDRARRSSPSPTQKVVPCTSCYSHS